MNRRSALAGWSLVLAFAAGLVVLRAIDPATSSFFPGCPFHLLTGLDCPGCGLTRATHALLHGNLSAAVGYNALIPLYLALLLPMASGQVIGLTAGRYPAMLRVRAGYVAVSGLLMVGFGVLRNVV